MKLRTEQINGLTCHIMDGLDEGVRPREIVVLCHGYGATGTDLIPIGQMLAQHPKLLSSVQWLFPEAPTSLAELGMPDGRAWWPIDMFQLQMAIALGTFRDLRNNCPPELPFVRDQLLGLIKTWSEQSQVPISHFVLGGFSQGAMLASETTLHMDENPCGLVILSGTLLNEDVWTKRAVHHKLLRVFQSHGQDDQILPFSAAGWLRDLLKQSGADVDFVPFHGGHEIPLEVLSRLGSFIKETLGDGRTSY